MIKFLIIGICLLFPILCYLVFLVPIKEFSLEKNNLYFSFTLVGVFFFLFILSKTIEIEIIFFFIPLVIAYLLRKENIALFLSLSLLIIYNYLDITKFLIVLLVITSYFIISKLVKKKRLFLIFSFISILFLLIIFRVKFSLLILDIAFFFIYLELIFLAFKRMEFISSLCLKTKELEKERNIKNSIFKLTHELKNPLAVCNGYIEMMDLANKEKSQEYFSILKSEIKRSLTIINDFSSLGKIKDLEKEELDIYYVLEEIKDTLKPMFNSKNADIILNNDKEIYLEGDYSRLKQVFINLLKNALEAKNKENILINIKAYELKDRVKVTIKDNGCGMTKEQLEHIEDIFYTTKENGSGLGLPYCKEIIELHGGNINFKSIKDKGTTVTLYFPNK